jgi:hypothetical protein
MNKPISKISLNRCISNLIALVPCLLISSCQSSVQTYSSCEQNKGEQTLDIGRVINPEQIRQNSLSNISFKNPSGIKFEAKKGQTFFYTAEDLASNNKKSGGNFCVLVRENSTNKPLDSYALNHLPSNGFYTLEVYSLDRNETINQNISIKASLNSDNFRIPLDVELEALYQFEDAKLALTDNTLNEMVLTAAKEKANDNLRPDGDSSSKQDYYKQLFEDQQFRTKRLKEVLANNKLDIDSGKEKLKIKEIIEAIYIFQVRFLDSKTSQLSPNGILNMDTKKALVSLILNDEKNIEITRPEATSNKKINEYKAKITSRIQRYFLNIYEQRCHENWEMLGNTGKKIYKDKKLEYAKYCFRDKEAGKEAVDLKDQIVQPQQSSDKVTDTQNRIFMYVDFQIFKNVNPERVKFCFAPFSAWDGKSDIKIDMTSEDSCKE